jgi:hypothetical protein
MAELQWHEDLGGTFVADIHRFRLKVRWTAGRRYVRFLVFQRSNGSESLVGSGTMNALVGAMGAAELMAKRFQETSPRGEEVVAVVDSDDFARAAAVGVIKGGGYDTIEAVTGEGALRRMERTTRPTILVAEVRLNGAMTGFELAATACSLWPGTGIVLMGRRPSSFSWIVEEEFLAVLCWTAPRSDRIDWRSHARICKCGQLRLAHQQI